MTKEKALEKQLSRIVEIYNRHLKYEIESFSILQELEIGDKFELNANLIAEIVGFDECSVVYFKFENDPYRAWNYAINFKNRIVRKIES